MTDSSDSFSKSTNNTPISEQNWINMPTSLTHQCIVLIGFTFVIFELFFLSLYIDKFWFNIDIKWLGIPAVFISLALAHFLLIWLESDFSCQAFSFLFQGKPPIVYRKWLAINNLSIRYGIRYMRKVAIEEIALTPFGNLLFKSRFVCGAEQKTSDVLIKIPFSVASLKNQKDFIANISVHDLVLNKRLTNAIKQKYIRGMGAVQNFGVLFMAVILLDLGYSSFYYLQMLKEYYLAQMEGKNNSVVASTHLNAGDLLLANVPKWSFASSRFVLSGPTAAHIYLTRSYALHNLQREQEAIASALDALDHYPTSFRINLYLVRLYTKNKQDKLAETQINEAIENHKHAFLPELYQIVIAKIFNGDKEAREKYNQSLTQLNEDVFADEPMWPPGGNRFLHEVFYSEDVQFIFDNLLSTN
jgi:hypothetical protein